MHRYPHHITGLFGRRDCAETALSKLMHRGLHSDQLHISVSNHRLPTGALQINRESKINLMLRQGGLPPVPTDYIAWARGVPAATTDLARTRSKL